MKKLSIPLAFLFISLLSSCEAIGDIFKAGAVTGIIAVIAVVGIIIWIFAKIAG